MASDDRRLRVLIVKQHLDATGPRQSFMWQEGIEKDVLESFKGKTSTWETFCYFEADLLIVPTMINAPWLQTVMQIPGYVEEMQKTTTDVMDIRMFPLHEYDVVITHDPILFPFIKELKMKYPKVVFAYIMAEHSSWQMHTLGFEYDLYLDHTNSSVDDVVRLPQAVNFVYPRVPGVIAGLFGDTKKYTFLDYRSIGHLNTNGKNDVAITPEICDEYVNKLQDEMGDLINYRIPTVVGPSEASLKPYMFGSKSDSVEYYQKLADSKYFITVANRIGQAAYDAASAGALVIGNADSQLHRLICHPDLLMQNDDITVQNLGHKIRTLELDAAMFGEYLDFQMSKLDKICVERPRRVFEEAIKLKRKND